MSNELHVHGLSSWRVRYRPDSQCLVITFGQRDYLGRPMSRETDLFLFAGDNATADLLMTAERGALREMAAIRDYAEPEEDDYDEPADDEANHRRLAQLLDGLSADSDAIASGVSIARPRSRRADRGHNESQK